MTETLYIRRAKYVPASQSHLTHELALRDTSPDEFEWMSLLPLSDSQAAALAGPHSGIFYYSKADAAEAECPPQLVHISRVNDRSPGAPAWQLSIGEEPICSISDGTVITLQQHLNAESLKFATGQPDWDLRAADDLSDKILEMEASLVALRKKEAEHRHASKAARRAAGLDVEEEPIAIPDGLRPMAEVGMRVPVLARFKAAPPIEGRLPDGFSGKFAVVWAEYELDRGRRSWAFAAPVGHGGWSDDWFDGWVPLPGQNL